MNAAPAFVLFSFLSVVSCFSKIPINDTNGVSWEVYITLDFNDRYESVVRIGINHRATGFWDFFAYHPPLDLQPDSIRISLQIVNFPRFFALSYLDFFGFHFAPWIVTANESSLSPVMEIRGQQQWSWNIHVPSVAPVQAVIISNAHIKVGNQYYNLLSGPWPFNEVGLKIYYRSKYDILSTYPTWLLSELLLPAFFSLFVLDVFPWRWPQRLKRLSPSLLLYTFVGLGCICSSQLLFLLTGHINYALINFVCLSVLTIMLSWLTRRSRNPTYVKPLLPTLPPEVLLLIGDALPPTNRANLRMTCRAFSNLWSQDQVALVPLPPQLPHFVAWWYKLYLNLRVLLSLLTLVTAFYFLGTHIFLYESLASPNVAVVRIILFSSLLVLFFLMLAVLMKMETKNPRGTPWILAYPTTGTLDGIAKGFWVGYLCVWTVVFGLVLLRTICVLLFW